MAKLYQICCPKCNNKTDFYRYGKDKYGYQKYQCKKCRHQWAPEAPSRPRGYPSGVRRKGLNTPRLPCLRKAYLLTP